MTICLCCGTLSHRCQLLGCVGKLHGHEAFQSEAMNKAAVRDSLKVQTEKPPGVDGVGKAYSNDVIMNSEVAIEAFGGQGIRIHRDDVLEAARGSPACTELKGLGYLSLIDAIK